MVDNRLLDVIQRIAHELAHLDLLLDSERSTRHDAGSAYPWSDILGFIDSDMTVAQGVVEEYSRDFAAGAGAVRAPAITAGNASLAPARAVKHPRDLGDGWLEPAGAFTATLFRALSGASFDRTCSHAKHNGVEVSHSPVLDEGGPVHLAQSPSTETTGPGALLSTCYGSHVRPLWRSVYLNRILGIDIAARMTPEMTAISWCTVNLRRVGTLIGYTPT